MWVVQAENKLNRKIAQLFGKVMNQSVQAVMNANELTPAKQKEVLRLIESQSGKSESIFKEAIQSVAKQGGKKMVSNLKGNGIKVSFHNFSKSAKTILNEKAFQASETTMSKVTGRVMDNLKTSYEKGYGIDKAAQRLKTEFTDLTDRGLKRIARTEINSAQNQGAHLTLQDLGVEFQMWWTAEDDRVRGDGPNDQADHISLHGQIVRVGDPFENELLYPGDMNGDISEWIECRCTLVPFIMPLGMKAPDMPYFYESDLIPVDEKTESNT